MTPSQAEAKGLERASKYAKSTKYGRQNPISARWNSDEQLVVWRKAWADAVNAVLERKGFDERIDHRSHAERGIEEQPTIHEGVTARAMEAKGFVSDRCELNRQIKADNLWLRITRDAVAKLTAAFENIVAGIAAALEAARERIIIADYGMLHLSRLMGRLRPGIDKRVAVKKAYDRVRKDIRTKTAERKKLQAEKKSLSPIHVKRHLELASSIAGLTEEIEELRSEKSRILARAKCSDDKGMKAFSDRLDQSKREYNDLAERKTALTEQRQDGITQYEDTYERIQAADEEAVAAEQQRIRETGHDRLTAELTDAYGDRFDPKLLTEAEKSANFTLGMDRRVYEHRKELYRQRQLQQDPDHTRKHDREAR